MIEWLIVVGGFSFAFGVLLLFIFLSLVGYVLAMWMPRDDSDPIKGPRSGLKIYTDHLTGVQYLKVGASNLVPRLDSTGYPVTIKRTK